MSNITQILNQLENGDPSSSEQLLPLVYEELRKLAAARLTQEQPGQTLQATALVHEAYVRLVGPESENVKWNTRGHFFAAAAEAMRRILVDAARRKKRIRHGGDRQKVSLEELDIGDDSDADETLALDEALERLSTEMPDVAEVVKLRYFAGLTIPQTAAAMDVSVRTANRHWAYAKAWLFEQLNT